MKITVNFSALDRAVEIMGAKRRGFVPDRQDKEFEPIYEKLKRGIKATIDVVDIDPKTGLFSFEGHQVLLYIQDHGGRISKAIESPAKGNKYHVSYCPALERMKSIGRYERYVVTNDTSGDFFITGADWVTKQSIEETVRLNVCKYCLSKLDYKNYKSNKWEIFKSFSLEEFFTIYQSYFKYQPKRKAGNAKDDNYTEDWKNISEEYRTSVGWGCEKCGVILNKHKSLLHTHHKNGVKGDNSVSNLAALCMLCHSEEPNHGHMTKSVTFEKRNKIIRLRREQKVL